MTLDNRIEAFARLGQRLKNLSPDELQNLASRARNANSWFDLPNVTAAFQGIANLLEEQYLREWLYTYDFPELESPKKVGIVMAGNIPLVGFHDLLSVLISGHHALVKTSSDDPHLIKFVVDELLKIEPRFADYITFVDLLKESEAIIATGSDNTSRYFEYYFASRPHIIRKNRSSAAILTGYEKPEELHALGNDIFQYFGLGCRNISKLFVPEGYRFDPFFEALEPYKAILDHHRYQNNYDYNKSILLVNGVPHLDNGFLLLTESKQPVSPISVLHYETYNGLPDLAEKMKASEEKTQCVVSSTGWYPKSFSFGQAQCPMVWDYADGVDTLAFLAKL
ncbi:acyl-CoA reductase [Adhaeribacter soli]|uniref:Acyl-CoA reductase n=1 Tax=Adhaeribacter soli TaxID=2607655 RepID=A0A5N1J7A3_9BACT|nr:acyl-CoA reductase [Adhaeribacter soli]KAA9340591.1 acyl-CoA reductase [Adhaeribacter soli]